MTDHDHRLDLVAIRRDTPSATRQHFLSTAGSSLMPKPVVEAMTGYLELEARVGGYAAAAAEATRIDAVYDSIAALINARRDEIALTTSATDGWQRAFYSLHFSAGDRILTAEAEYAANYVAYLQVARRTGAVIEVIPSDPHGEVDTEALERMIDERVKLISISWIPTNGGLTNPAAEIGRIARKNGIVYLLDACQAVGQLPVDVEALGCDILTATARKFLRGPRGAGFLYVRRALLDSMEPNVIDHFAAPWTEADRYELRPDARRFETWEANYGLRLGMGAAADYFLAAGPSAIAARCLDLGKHLRESLAALTDVTVHDLGRDPCAIVTFSKRGVDPDATVKQAAKSAIMIGSSHPASTLLDASKRDLPTLMRASPHYFNTADDIEALVKFVSGI